MSFTVSDAITEMQLETKTVGKRISDTDFILYLNRANQHYQTGYRMPTSERKTDLLLFSGIYEYPAPSDFGGLIPLRKPLGISSTDFDQRTVRSLARWQYGNVLAVSYDRDTPYFVIRDTEGSSMKLHGCDDYDADGTWVATGDGSGLEDDLNIFVEGTGSMKFTVTASGGTTTLTNSALTNPLDITDYLTKGYAFLDLQCPSGNTTALTSVELRIGSDASNYYSLTGTTRYRGNTILGGWGPIGMAMSGKTTTGTPDYDSIDYLQVIITHGTTGVDGTYRLDNIMLAIPAYYQEPYYSSYNVLDGDGSTYKEEVTDTDDTILCPQEFKGAYVYKALQIAAVEALQDSGLANYFTGELAPKERWLKTKYPSQERHVSTNTYSRVNEF